MLEKTHETYSSKNPVIIFLAKIFLRNVSKLIPKANSNVILDVGCAEGDMISFVKKRNKNLKIIGLDIDLQRLRYANSYNQSALYIQGSAYALPFNDDEFELIFATELLEHLNDTHGALSEVRRVCRGYCLISVPYEPFFQIGNVLRGKHLQRRGRTPKHVHFWRRREIAEIIGAHFSIVSFKISFPWLIFLCKI